MKKIIIIQIVESRGRFFDLKVQSVAMQSTDHLKVKIYDKKNSCFVV